MFIRNWILIYFDFIQMGNIVLMYVVYGGYESVVKLLLEFGVDIIIQNEDNMNVMDMVVGQGNKISMQNIEY